MAYKLSMQWLKEWVNLAVDHKYLAGRLDMAGIEVGGISPVAGEFTHVVVAKVLEAEQHPDADRLRVCQVSIGAETLSIVCGASNVRAGLKVALAKVGGRLPNGMILKEVKLRGALSQGMICSMSELGLAESSEGIMELPNDAPLGMDLVDYLQLNDETLSIEFTPNRGDCLSVLGLAREISALCDLPLLMPSPEIPISASILDVLPVRLDTQAACPRYLGRLVRDIDPKASTPLWMKERLRRSGIRSIHPVVDVTNYVMLELGQPMHAFDADRLEKSIEVRHAKAGEQVALLNGQTVSLDVKTQVIADQSQVHAIAGVMGALEGSVSASTQHIFLESAFFSPLSVAYSTQHYNITSDSAYRFERGVDFNLQKRAIERATQLILDIVGGQAGPIIDATSTEHLPQIKPILLRSARLEKVLGLALDSDKVETALRNLNMQLTPDPLGWQVLAPSYRFDIQQEIDLIEEVARVLGYEHIPAHLPTGRLHANIPSQYKLELKQLSQALVYRGYQEMISYSFVNEPLQIALNPHMKALKLSNPISSEMGVMRTSLWPGLIQAARYNQNRQQTSIRLFEMGNCFPPPSAPSGHLPPQGGEEKRLAGLAIGDTDLDFFDVKGDVEVLLQLTGRAAQFEFIAAQHPALHPKQTAKIMKGQQLLGYLGTLHPKLLSNLDIKGPVYLFEFDLDQLLVREQSKVDELPKFPCVRRDIAIIVKRTVPYALICNKIKGCAGELLKDVQLFDLYQGQNIAPDSQSIALALTFQDPNRTLVDAEVNERIAAVLEGLEHEFSALVRS